MPAIRQVLGMLFSAQYCGGSSAIRRHGHDPPLIAGCSDRVVVARRQGSAYRISWIFTSILSMELIHSPSRHL